MIHAYKLSFTSTLGTCDSALSQSAAPSLETKALPQLVFRAALGALGGGNAVPLIVAHPTRPALLGVVVPGDTAVRFFDVSPPSARGQEVALGTDCSAGVAELASRTAIARAAFSRDGSVLAIADTSARVTVMVFKLREGEGSGGGLTVTAEPALTFSCDTAVTALVVAHVPAPAAANRFSRFKLNAYAVVTGHVNGFLNIWWCGDNVNAKDGAATAPLAARGGGRSASGATVMGRGAARTSSARAASPPSPPPAPPREPLATYPPFHASRGPITHISPPFSVNDRAAGAELAAAGLFSSARRSGAHGGAATLFCVGAHGAIGWRVYALPHVAPREMPGVDPGAGWTLQPSGSAAASNPRSAYTLMQW